ncbi:MAG: AMP-binding protein [Burkholderiaceae bacterium]
MSAPVPPPSATVRELVLAQAATRPDAPFALAVDGSQTITFGALADDCRAVGAWLRAHGSQPGDVVSVVMPNGLQTLRVLLGAMHGGWCVNPVNLMAQPEQMRYVLTHSDCRVVIVSPDREAVVRELLAGIGRPVAVLVTEPDAGRIPHFAPDDPRSDAVPAPDAMALLMYTSGTTGTPKGVMLTQRNLAANALAVSHEHGLTAADRVLAVLPLYHINAFVVTMLAPLAHGGSLAMAPRFSAARFWSQALEHRCSWLNVVPTMIAYLLEGADAPVDAGTALRFCRSASAALPPEHLRAFEGRFGVGVVETMGLTETAAPAFSNPMDAHQRKLGAVGCASGCEARVVDATLQPVADGVTGEITIRGPNVMSGYYKNPQASADTFTADGWLRTGDLGHRDADGFFFVTGRIKELIIKGGENIAPREIDEVLLQHPALLEAAAVGIPDRHYGQEIMACVVVRDGHACSEDDLRAYCEQHLGRFKTPKVWRFVSELPRGPSGKVQRLRLLDTNPP